ncbi:MAG: dihydroorotase [Lachnospiraceae bacterium]|nr:dihydroorotase [Lachnospiraceae bacterium]
MLLIKNAYLIEPSVSPINKSGTGPVSVRAPLESEEACDGPADLLVDEKGILSSGKKVKAEDYPEAEVIDAEGLCLAPGLIDIHVHFRDPGFPDKETAETGAGAAAAGGVTSVVCMANTIPPFDRPDRLMEFLHRTERLPIHLYQASTVTEGRAGKRLVDMAAMKEAGALLFTDDGSPLMDRDLVREAMREAAALGVPISFHEEDPAFVGVAGINEGRVSKAMGLKGADRRAEISMVDRDIELAFQTGCQIDIQHISARETVELIRQARRDDSGGLIHAEATPNHFSLTEEAVEAYGSLVKINPPLRTEDDRQAIIEGIADGTIDLIVTDHAPHTSEEKKREFPKAPSGIIGLETALSLGLLNLVEPGYLTLQELMERMSLGPAEFLGLKGGSLKAGRPGDLVIFDPKAFTDYSRFESRSENSPFRGKTLPGRVLYTIADGEIIYRKESRN